MARVPEHVRITQSPGGAVLLDLKRGRMYTLNLAGSQILELLEKHNNSNEIANELSREFDIEGSLALHDVEEFLGALATHQLIEFPTKDRI